MQSDIVSSAFGDDNATDAVANSASPGVEGETPGMTIDSLAIDYNVRPMTAGHKNITMDVNSEGALNYFQDTNAKISRPQSIH